MDMKQTIRRFLIVAAFGMTGFSLLAATLLEPAEGAETRWIPYVFVQKSTEAIVWGQPVPDFLYKLNYNGTVSTTPNVVWDIEEVWPWQFQGNYKASPYGQGYSGDPTENTETTFKIYIHNPTDTDYTTGDDRIILSVWDKAGTKVTDADDLRTDQTSSNDPTWLEWGSANERFRVSIPSNTTRVVDIYDIFDEPDVNEGPGAFAIRLLSKAGTFSAHIRGQVKYRAREDIDNDDRTVVTLYEKNYSMEYGYAALDKDMVGGTQYLMIPYWKDTNPSAYLEEEGEKWTTFVCIVNAANPSTENVDIVAEVFNHSGSEYTPGSTGGVTFTGLGKIAGHGFRWFIPSQFFDPPDVNQDTDPAHEGGYVKISVPSGSDAKPVAIALMIRFWEAGTTVDESDEGHFVMNHTVEGIAVDIPEQ